MLIIQPTRVLCIEFLSYHSFHSYIRCFFHTLPKDVCCNMSINRVKKINSTHLSLNLSRFHECLLRIFSFLWNNYDSLLNTQLLQTLLHYSIHFSPIAINSLFKCVCTNGHQNSESVYLENISVILSHTFRMYRS